MNEFQYQLGVTIIKEKVLSEIIQDLMDVLNEDSLEDGNLVLL